MAQASGVDFLPDLFYPIVYHVKDLPNLWNYRQVSRNFAKAVEQVFINKHLNKIWLSVDCGMSYTQKHGKVFFACDFSFDRIDPSNPSRAIFSEKVCASEFQSDLKKKLRSRLQYGNPAHQPQFQVQVRRDVNDTAIPGLEVDYDKLEVSFDWKGLYSAFFREEREYSRRMKEWSDSMKSELHAMKARVESGEIDQMETFKFIMEKFGGAHDSVRKDVRRDRICKEVLADEGVEYTWTGNEDAAALKKLKDARFGAGCEEPFSDESDGEREEEEEEEEDAMDEEDDNENLDEEDDEDVPMH